LVDLNEKGDDSDRAVVSVIAQRIVEEEEPVDTEVDPEVPTAGDEAKEGDADSSEESKD